MRTAVVATALLFVACHAGAQQALLDEKFADNAAGW